MPRDKFGGRRIYLRTWPHSRRGRIVFAVAMASALPALFLVAGEVGLAAFMFAFGLLIGLPVMLNMQRFHYIELGEAGFRRTAITPQAGRAPGFVTSTDVPYDSIVALEPHRQTIVRVRYHSEPLIGSQPTHRVMLLDVDDRERLIHDLQRRAKDVTHGETIEAVGENQTREGVINAGRAVAPYMLVLSFGALMAVVGAVCR